MPILGICAGLQLIQIVSGGKLIQHLRRAKNHLGDNYHSISIISGRLLMKMYGLGRITVNSSHHQAADPAGIPSSLEVAAIAGDGTVEALEGKGARFLLAVQWHPERMIASREYGNTMKLFRAFVGAARACA
jgi:putative glutamine amidotransferase